jgi:tetratricopeptide (TPR) repeat protein
LKPVLVLKNNKRILPAIGLLAVILLYAFGSIVPAKKPLPAQAPTTELTFDIQGFIKKKKPNFRPDQLSFLAALESTAQQGSSTEQMQANEQLAAFWKDSARQFEPYAYYISTAAKLDNSEKKLTFAAQLILDYLRGEPDAAKLNWETNLAIDLFERAIKLNPSNDDLRIGLGSCYIFGKGRNGNAEETMKGIQEVLVVARKDSNNMKAQLVLGIGGVVSGQYAKAIERLNRVVKAEPENMEAIAFLADAYAAAGNKEAAIRWYGISKKLVNDPHYSEEVDKRIQSLK